MAAVMNLSGRPTSHAAFMTILAENAAPEAPQDPAALDQFLQWKSEITRAASGPLLLCLRCRQTRLAAEPHGHRFADVNPSLEAQGPEGAALFGKSMVCKPLLDSCA
jgi:hypothetical protein